MNKLYIQFVKSYCKVHNLHLCSTVLWVILFVGGSALAQSKPDPVLEFYCSRAAAVGESRSPIERGLNYSYRATTFYKQLGRGGRVGQTDSSVVDQYFSFGNLDSQVTVVKPTGSMREADLTYPNVFAGDYEFYFFPNDTGGPELAIGFDIDTGATAPPTGLAIIDREQFNLTRLHLGFRPRDGELKKYTRSMHFVVHEGYVFPDTVIESGSRHGVFAADHFRIETVLTRIRINR